MSIRLEGWRAVGLVLSILWFVGFAAWGWNDSIEQNRHKFTAGLNDCYRSETQRPSDTDWTQFRECLDKEKALFAQEFESNRRSIPILLAIDLFIIVMAWLVAWLLAAMLRRARG
jgi:hypothetical protein